MSEALLVSPREAAKLLAVSARKLWSMTFDDDPGPSSSSSNPRSCWQAGLPATGISISMRGW